MLDIGQPMHAFDAAHVSGREVRVRRARAGEKITTLDGQERALVDSDLLICAGDEPEALAGVTTIRAFGPAATRRFTV